MIGLGSDKKMKSSNLQWCLKIWYKRCFCLNLCVKMIPQRKVEQKYSSGDAMCVGRVVLSQLWQTPRQWSPSRHLSHKGFDHFPFIQYCLSFTFFVMVLIICMLISSVPITSTNNIWYHTIKIHPYCYLGICYLNTFLDYGLQNRTELFCIFLYWAADLCC